MDQDNSNPIMLNYHDSLLRASDIELLGGPHWLNDTIISFFFEYLQSERYANDTLLFVSPQVTQCIKISQANEVGIFLEPLDAHLRDFIFFALNNNVQTETSGGSHWSLLVFSYPERKCFHFDSLRGANRQQAAKLGSKLLKFFNVSNPEEGVVEMRSLQQNNGYDCGVFVIAQTEMLAEYVREYRQIEGSPTLQRRVLDGKRVNVLDLVTFLRREADGFL